MLRPSGREEQLPGSPSAYWSPQARYTGLRHAPSGGQTSKAIPSARAKPRLTAPPRAARQCCPPPCAAPPCTAPQPKHAHPALPGAPLAAAPLRAAAPPPHAPARRRPQASPCLPLRQPQAPAPRARAPAAAAGAAVPLLPPTAPQRRSLECPAGRLRCALWRRCSPAPQYSAHRGRWRSLPKAPSRWSAGGRR
jgi:hypothetical protein